MTASFTGKDVKALGFTPEEAWDELTLRRFLNTGPRLMGHCLWSDRSP